MNHVLLTPPGQATTFDNLGILQVDCWPAPEPARSILTNMSRDGWTISVILDVDEASIRAFGPKHPARVRGKRYLDETAGR